MDIIALLKSKDLSVTANRIKIIECLSDDEHFHTIADLVNHLKKRANMTIVNTKSVYNNVKSLVEVGLVDSYSFGGVSKYALNDNLNNESENLSIHLVHPEEYIDHLNIPKEVANTIKNEVEKSGFEVTSIKVFVNVTKK